MLINKGHVCGHVNRIQILHLSTTRPRLLSVPALSTARPFVSPSKNTGRVAAEFMLDKKQDDWEIRAQSIKNNGLKLYGNEMLVS